MKGTGEKEKNRAKKREKMRKKEGKMSEAMRRD